MYALTTADDISEVAFNLLSILVSSRFPDTVIADRENTEGMDLRENNNNILRNPVSRLWHNWIVTKRSRDTRVIDL
jgi:hypothetical protein